MSYKDINLIVLDVFEAVLKRTFEEGENITRQDTPEWDSLKHMEVIFALEDELGIEFSEDELVRLDSLAKIVESVMQKNAT